MIRVIYNPKCSKSRKVLSILDDKKIVYDIRSYLEKPLDLFEIEEVLSKLEINAKDAIRMSEHECKDLDFSSLEDSEILDLMIKHPKVIQRPIVINADKAIIARPPELVEQIL